MKTLVAPAHVPGPAQNGHNNCFARIASQGICPGVQTAKFLNSLGEDDEIFTTTFTTNSPVTNGKLRDTYLRENYHVVAVQPKLAQLAAEERRLSAELRRVKHELRRLREVA
jgi:hypothetical protein